MSFTMAHVPLIKLPEIADESAVHSATPDIRDLLGLLDAAESAFADHVFLVSDKGIMTYGSVGTMTRRAAGWFVRAGVRRGDRVLVTAANQLEVILIALAAMRLGAVVALLHEGTTPRNLKRVAEQIRPAVTVFGRSTIGLGELVTDSIVVAIDPDPGLARVVPVPELFAEPDAILVPASLTPEDPACLIFTSGSTGEPRGVVVSHDNIVFTTAAIQERLRYRRDDVIGLFVPLSFDYGFYQVFLAANVGASVYVGEHGSAGPAILHLIGKHDISVLPMIPGLVGSLLKLLDRGGEILPNLRCLTSTGDHLPVPHIEALQRRLPGARIFPMYGLTECKRVSILLPEELARKPGTVGRPLIGTTVRVVGPTGDSLPPGVSGELVVSGRNVTLGYWQTSAETERRFRLDDRTGKRELWTGDIGQIDEDGFLRVLGRTDALLKHQGFRISSAEIELEACRAPGVVEAGLVCSAKGELHLFARFAEANGGPAGVRQLLRDNLEWYKIPEHVHVVDELPRTLNGKTDWTELEAMANAS
jgi:acyl-coenzyme A synthetase/AMP-(fatty) acid ligase